MSGVRVLVVEDDLLIALHIERVLKRMGHQVVGQASSGEGAIEQAHNLQPELILMDIHLNGRMDGIQAAQEIQAERAIPVIYLTAYAGDERITAALAGRPGAVLGKPLYENELRLEIERLQRS